MLDIALAAYILLITTAWMGWVLTRHQPQAAGGHHALSVVIPARDEERTLPQLLDDLATQTCNSFETIVVNDHSSDRTAQFGQARLPATGGQLLELDGAHGKKAALDHGIRVAQGPIVVTTDADCRVGPGWLEKMQVATSHAKTVLGPVEIVGRSALGQFQAFDMIVLMLVTAASARLGKPVLANGANMAFSKSDYNAIGGYETHRQVSSGDDVLLMKDMIRLNGPGSVRFLKHREAIVKTNAAQGFKDFLHQRARWVSKGARMTGTAKGLMMAAYAVAVGLIVVAINGISGSLELRHWLVGAVSVVVTISALASVTSFFGRTSLLLWSPLLIPTYLLYIVLIPIVTVCIRPVWKGRPVRS